ncbi:MAG: phosphoribosylglycinamide formyltransferase [Bacteroidales bacterium]|nr:phosphoribosylglycinamide formyltransferase [Bacteroidales bacterium]
MKRLAIFASGNGTNAQRITEYFANNGDIHVELIIYNKKDAYVAQRARNLGVPAHYFKRTAFESGEVRDFLLTKHIDYVILAGFLLLVPQNLLDSFPNRIINIHPALLPKYGGRGMYGEHVHEAVIAAREKESGITIHVIDGNYDQGTTLYQAKCTVTGEDTPDTLAQKIHVLEQQYFPKVIEDYIVNNG